MGGKKKKGGPARVAKRVQPKRHVDAVMCIAWNPAQRNLVATGSADTTIKLWDLNRPETAVAHYTHHKNKVQALAWNPQQPTVLLSGGYDQKACVFDSRDPTSVMTFNLTADVECMKWDPINAERFYVSTEDGIVKCFDVKNGGPEAVFTLHAHDGAVSALDINPHLPGCLVTGSSDKNVKVWSLKDDKPHCIVSRDVGVGKVFAAAFSPDSPYILSVSGSKGKVLVWNLEDNSGMRRNFPSAQPSSTPRPELTQVEEVEEVEDDEDDMDEPIEEGDYEDEELMEDV